MQGADALRFIEDVDAQCGKYSGRAFFASCVGMIAREDPLWAEQFSASLTPERVFSGSGGVAVVQVLEELAAEGDAGSWALLLAEEGGLGSFGGSNDQIDRAATIAIALQDDPAKALGYVRKVMDSPNAPGQAMIGNTLVAFLFAPSGECWPGGSAASAMTMAAALLEDGRFASEAAAQLLYGFREQAPPGVSTEDWVALRERARGILE